jgi:hypothetical protein
MITDHQMATANIAYQGLVDAQKGLPPSNISDAYLDLYGQEYEQGELDTANERPF